VCVSERGEEFSYLFWSPVCLNIQYADLSATLISETCEKPFDSDLNTNNACRYMRLSDCGCFSTSANVPKIQLSSCSFGFDPTVLNPVRTVIHGEMFEEYLEL
jgi:hypothetical protein